VSGIFGLLRNARAFAGDPVMWRLARTSIMRYGALQYIDELTPFARLLAAKRPRTVLEIGTAQGGMFWLFCQIAAPDALLISLDLPPSQRTYGGLPVEVDLQAMKRSAQFVKTVRANSHAAETKDAVQNILEGRRLDLLFIDGDHSYDGVKLDYQLYSPLVDKNGIVAFHDISPRTELGVRPFWEELKRGHLVRELLSIIPSLNGGIGILFR
jgi:cephalosporin hydroxylase